MTKQEKVAAWMKSLNYRWSQGGYWVHDKNGLLAPDQATFFYDVTVEARIDENESLLLVAEHEIGLPDRCDMHDEHSSHCHACKKRKWYGEISKDWRRVIEERLHDLK